jgi:hypothetical protein
MSILRARNKKPIINFGLGVTEVTISLNDIVKLYQTTIYNIDSIILLETDLRKVKINNNQFEITGNIEGTHEIRAVLNGTIRGNKIIINVV